MSKKNYYGQVCITACLDFYVSDTDESIEDVENRILDAGFDIKLIDRDGNEFPKDKLEITQIEGELISEEVKGNVQQPYTDSFWITEDE